VDTAQTIVAILGAGGGGVVLSALVNGFFKQLSGAAGREQAKNTDLSSQRNEAIVSKNAAEKERDAADKQRRQVEEYNSLLIRQIIELGETPLERPYDHTLSKEEIATAQKGDKNG
jgi:hypothetical protein